MVESTSWPCGLWPRQGLLVYPYERFYLVFILLVPSNAQAWPATIWIDAAEMLLCFETSKSAIRIASVEIYIWVSIPSSSQIIKSLNGPELPAL